MTATELTAESLGLREGRNLLATFAEGWREENDERGLEGSYWFYMGIQASQLHDNTQETATLRANFHKGGRRAWTEWMLR